MGFFQWTGKKIFIGFFPFSEKQLFISLGVTGNKDLCGFVLLVPAAYSRQKGNPERRA